MFKDAIECYEAIGASLAKAAKKPWDRIVVNATLDGVRVDVRVGCWLDGHPGAVEYLPGVPLLARSLYELARLASTEDKGLFKTCEFIVYRNGKFAVDFNY
jgi:hypothetical protein